MSSHTRIAQAACALAASAAAALLGAAPAGASAPAVERLSAAQLAGQRVVYGFAGHVPPPSLLARVRAGEVAGVIFFRSNIAGPAQLAAVARRLQLAAAQSPVRVPLLLMVDQEGGLVRRLPGAPALSQRQIGERPDAPAAAAAAGRGAAATLKGAGLNVNLAPVLDVMRGAGGLMGGAGRSYGFDAATDGALGARFVTAQQAAGVAATAKHFPGLGAAAAADDTDRRAVTLATPLAELRAVDELPYSAAIASGVKLVMLSWARYPALDAALPAGLSPAVVQGELRGRLGFKGVTISDALRAHALDAFGAIPARAAAAAAAGDDLVLPSGRSVRQADDAAGGIVAALRRGGLSRAGMLASVRRVIALRQSLGTLPRVPPPRLATLRPGSRGAAVRALQRRLAALGYLPGGAADGTYGTRTWHAVVAFQGWDGMARDGIAGPATRRALAKAARPRPWSTAPGFEIHLGRQVLLLVSGGRVVRAIHVSTGAGGRTPVGRFQVYSRQTLSWSVQFQVWMPLAQYFYAGYAMHAYSDVPAYPASHGCVRLPADEARAVWDFGRVGMRVWVGA